MSSIRTNQASLRARSSLAAALTLAAALLTIGLSFAGSARAQGTDATAEPDQGGTGSPTCTGGDNLFGAGEYDEARKAYAKALSETTEEPVKACAQRGIRRVDRMQAAADCELGDKYRDLNRDEDAITAYKAALAIEPGLSCAKQGLEDAGPSWPTRAVDWIGEKLVVVGLLLLAFFLLVQFGRLRPVGRLFLRIPLLGRWVSPRLSVEAIADDAVSGKPGASLSAKVKEAMREAWDEVTSDEPPPAYELGRISARQELADLASDDPAVKSGLEKASSISEPTKLVAALLGLLYVLLPIKRFVLSGTLTATGSAGEVTLLLERDAKLEATTTLTVTPAENEAKASDYVRLAAPAAVWTEYEVARILTGRRRDPDGTLSYVALREAMGYVAAKDATKARASFQRAVLRNRRNWAAYMGLAAVDRGGPDTYLRSLETLEYALGEMREHYGSDAGSKPPIDERPFLADPTYYGMGYSLASRLTNGRLDPALSAVLARRAPGAPSVAQITERLIGEADTMVAWCRHRDYWGKGTIWLGLKASEKRLWVFLTDTVRPSLQVLLAVSLLETDPVVARARVAGVREMESAPAAQRGKITYRTLYNLACFEASPRSAGEDAAIDETQAMKDLEMAIREAPGSRRDRLIAEASADPSLKLLRDNAEFKRLQEILGAAKKPAAEAKKGPWWRISCIGTNTSGS